MLCVLTFILLSHQPAATRRSNRYTTPARSEIVPSNSESETVPKFVTPSEPSNDVATIRASVTNSPLGNEQGDLKQVRFGPGNTTDSPRQQNRGLVSRRGGRYASPANRSALAKTQSDDSISVTKDEAVAEYNTFRTPSLKRRDDVPHLSIEQRQESDCSPSEFSIPPDSSVETNADTTDDTKVPRLTRKDDTINVRKHAFYLFFCINFSHDHCLPDSYFFGELPKEI